jgi:UDP-3-O-[3-hydroxymyristoyl] glucosamine N-acyltransferase
MTCLLNGADLRSRGIAIGELAPLLGGTVEGDPETRVYGVGGLDDAGDGVIVRVEAERYLEKAVASPAAALLIDRALPAAGKPAIRVAKVRLAFAKCLALFSPDVPPPPGVHPAAIVPPTAEVGEGCSIGAFAVVGERARLGRGVILHPHAVVGTDAEVGDGSEIFPHAVLYARTVVGRRVRIHAGAVIGADGYGFEWAGDHHERIPQIGRVRLGDDVEVGANTTIDRATTGETVIGPGTKIDNLVQIGHNTRTGAHCLIIAQVGIAGSCTLGNGVVMAGQSGMKDHVHLGDGLQVAARSGIWGDHDGPGVISGHPARPHREEVRIQAALGRLPELLKRVKELEKRLAELADG